MQQTNKCDIKIQQQKDVKTICNMELSGVQNLEVSCHLLLQEDQVKSEDVALETLTRSLNLVESKEETLEIEEQIDDILRVKFNTLILSCLLSLFGKCLCLVLDSSNLDNQGKV